MSDYESASMFVFQYKNSSNALQSGEIRKGSLDVMHFSDESDRTKASSLLDRAVTVWDSIMFHMCLVPTEATEDK